LATNQTAKAIPNFRMSRDRGLVARLRICVEVVPTAVSMENTPGGFNLADKITPFHTKTSISLVWVFSAGGGPSSSIIIR